MDNEVENRLIDVAAKAMFEFELGQARKEFDRLGIGLDDAENFFLGLRAESDAALVVLAASYIDAHLTDAWKRNMPGKSAAVYDQLFDNSGPLATMSAKISLAQGLSWLRDRTATISIRCAKFATGLLMIHISSSSMTRRFAASLTA